MDGGRRGIRRERERGRGTGRLDVEGGCVSWLGRCALIRGRMGLGLEGDKVRDVCSTRSRKFEDKGSFHVC